MGPSGAWDVPVTLSMLSKTLFRVVRNTNIPVVGVVFRHGHVFKVRFELEYVQKVLNGWVMLFLHNAGLTFPVIFVFYIFDIGTIHTLIIIGVFF